MYSSTMQSSLLSCKAIHPIEKNRPRPWWSLRHCSSICPMNIKEGISFRKNMQRNLSRYLLRSHHQRLTKLRRGHFSNLVWWGSQLVAQLLWLRFQRCASRRSDRWGWLVWFWRWRCLLCPVWDLSVLFPKAGRYPSVYLKTCLPASKKQSLGSTGRLLTFLA